MGNVRDFKLKENWDWAFVILVPSLLLALFALHNWWGPDFWYHLFLGREVWQQGTVSPTDHLLIRQVGYINQYWLFQSILYFANETLGFVGIRIVFISAWVATFWMWSSYFRRTLPAYLNAGFFLLGIVFFQHRFEYRPEVFSYLFMTASLGLLWRWMQRDWKLFSFSTLGLWCAVQWTWSNCHGYFFMGTALALLAAISALGEKDFKSAKKFSALALLGAAAVLLPPLSWKSWWDVWHLSGFLKAMSHGIEEFLPSYTPVYLRSWTVLLFWTAWLATLIALPFHFQGRNRIFQLGLAAVALYLSAKHYRNIPLLPLLCAPFWSSLAVRILSQQKSIPELLRPALLTSFGALSLVIAVTVINGKYFASRFSEAHISHGPSEIAFPVDFREYLEKNHFHGKILNEPSDGGYLEFYFPSMQLYGDSRFVDVSATTEFFRSLSNVPDFENLQARHSFDGTLLWILRQQQLIHYLMKNPKWRLAYGDLYRAFLVPVDSKAAAQLPEVRNWSGVKKWMLADNGNRIQQWLMFFADTGRTDDLLNLFATLEREGANSVNFARVAAGYGLQKSNPELVSRAEQMARRSNSSSY